MRFIDWMSDVFSSDLVALDDKQFRAFGAVVRTVRELAGQAQLARAGRGLALHLALGLALEPLSHPFEDQAEQRAAAVHIVVEEVVELLANSLLGHPPGLGARHTVLGLALDLGFPAEPPRDPPPPVQT